MKKQEPDKKRPDRPDLEAARDFNPTPFLREISVYGFAGASMVASDAYPLLKRIAEYALFLEGELKLLSKDQHDVD